MLALKLAMKNLLGAGLRTWLNVAVLSFAYVLIIFYNGMLDGWNRQGRNDTMDWDIGKGQFWHPEYDRFDFYTIQDAHALVTGKVKQLVDDGKLTPILLTQATVFPQGRMQGVLLKGIDPGQQILKIPSAMLGNEGEVNHAIIGNRMAKTLNVKEGDNMLIRWRDKNGTFDAIEIKIAKVFKSDVPPVDNGQVYMNLETVRRMTGMEGEATYLVSGSEEVTGNMDGWVYKDLGFLLEDFDKLIRSKRGGSMIMQSLLLIIALLAIFDTQILSIFRRQKEIGTYIALGMTRGQVVGIFTVEGGAHSILAALVGAAYGIPLFYYLDKIGITFGVGDMGVTMAETIFPYYSLKLIVTTLVFVVCAATFVSYLPAKRISKMRPTDALKGKIQ